MTLPLKELRTTDNLGEGSRRGLQKQWPLKNEIEDSLHWDYIQKVNYSVQDFNDCIARKSELTRMDVVYAITLVDWIDDAVERICSCYKETAVRAFKYEREEELSNLRNYFRGVRSFVNAHPLGTDRHEALGLDGTYVCIDIRREISAMYAHADKQCKPKNILFRLTPKGLESVADLHESDVILYTYLKHDSAKLFRYIGLNLDDVRNFAALCIDKLYEFDRYLGNLRQQDYQP